MSLSKTIMVINMNKWIVSGSIVIIIGLIIGVTSYKVVKTHQDKLILVEEKYIIEKAKECINEKKCNEEKVTLKELYTLEYLDKQSNPVTKKYYNEDSYVKYIDNEYIFVE